MAIAVKELRTQYNREVDGRLSGAVTTFHVSGLENVNTNPSDDHTIIVEEVMSHLLDNYGGDPPKLLGLPLRRVQSKRVSNTNGMVTTVWGTGRFGGGGYRPLQYRTTETRDHAIDIPVIKGISEVNGVYTQLVEYPWFRPLEIWKYNARIEDGVDFANAIDATTEHKGGQLRIDGYDWVFGGGDFRRLRSNEIRGELMFWHWAAMPEFAPGSGLGNLWKIPALGHIEEYAVLGDGNADGSISKYGGERPVIPVNTFNTWWDI